MAKTAMMVFCTLVLCLVGRPLWGAGDPQPGTILADELNLRSGPGRHHPPIATLEQGARVLVLSYEGEWVRILHREQTGFIMNRKSYLRIDERVLAENGDLAPSSPPDDPADKLNRELEVSRQKLTDFSKEESAVIDALEETEKALDGTRKQVARLSLALKAVELRIRELERQYRELEARSEINEKYIAGRLAALYKLGWLGKFNVLASAESMFDFFLSKRTLEQILAHDQAVMGQLARDKTRMEALMAKLLARKNEQQTTTANLSRRIDAMNTEQARREALLGEIRGKK
ncbi:MAG: SH3 domain-containing protein, partial [Desulfosarcina sp.]